MAGRIFINYRRGDDPGFAGRLFDRLEEGFASDQLFMDVDSIPPGYDFVRVLEEHVDRCHVLLAVIGRGWLDARDEAGKRRLENPDDFVRIEIESGLKLGKRVIPVLVNGAEMPRAEFLPEPLKPLARRNAVRLTHDRFKSDAQGLIKVLEDALAELASDEAAEVTRRERERQLEGAREEEAAAREKERARLQAIAGLSPEQIAKAEELANWEFIKESQNPQDFRDHLARFANGVVERQARARLEALTWSALGTEPGIDALQSYLAEFPFGAHAIEAQRRVEALQQAVADSKWQEEQERRETEAWAAASATGTRAALDAFLKEWPHGKHFGAARQQIRRLRGPHTWVAITYCLGVLPLIIFGGSLFQQLDVAVGVVSKSGQTGMLVASGVLVAVAALRLLRRGSALSELEFALYWFGALVCIAIGSAVMAAGFITPKQFALSAGILACASAILFGFFPRRHARGPEVAIYGIGFALACTFTGVALFDNLTLRSEAQDMGISAGALLGLAVLADMAVARWKRLTRTELVLYWVGSIPSLFVFFFALLEMIGVPKGSNGWLSLGGLAVAGAAAVFTYWKLGHRPQAHEKAPTVAGWARYAGITGMALYLLIVVRATGYVPTMTGEVWLNRDGAVVKEIDGRMLFENFIGAEANCLAKCREYTNCDGVRYANGRCALWEARTPSPKN